MLISDLSTYHTPIITKSNITDSTNRLSLPEVRTAQVAKVALDLPPQADQPESQMRPHLRPSRAEPKELTISSVASRQRAANTTAVLMEASTKPVTTERPAETTTEITATVLLTNAWAYG